MPLSILTLNLWRFYNWQAREPKIIAAIERFQPDLILFQEAQLDWWISPKNQVEILREKLGYQFSLFTSCGQRTNQQGKEVIPPAQLGAFSLRSSDVLRKIYQITKVSIRK